MTIGEIIQKYCDNHGLSGRAFATQCGVTNGYISMLINGANPKTGKPVKPQIDTYEKLASGMGMTLNQLFEIMDDAPVSIAVPSAIVSENITDFTDEEIELIRLYRGMNTVGQMTLIGTAKGLFANPDMKKGIGSTETGTFTA